MGVPLNRYNGAESRFRMALAACLALALAVPHPAGAQLDTSAIQSQGAVDGVARALMESSPRPGAAVVSEVVISDAFFAGAPGGSATVTTRFLREASSNALAAALARDLFPGPVRAAVVLHRAGFDGPAGFGELYGREARLAALEAQHRAAVEAAAADYRAQAAARGYTAAVPDGRHLMARSRLQAAQARYELAVRAYQAIQAEAQSMPAVTAELVRAVGEITAALTGQVSIEASPWGPQIRAALEAYEPETAAPPK